MAFAGAARANAPYDFDGDGQPDIVFRNAISGATYVWHIDAATRTLKNDAFVATIDPAWQVAGIGDFDGDGKPDLVWRNTATGGTYLWYMDDAAFRSDAFLFALSPEWIIQAVADFNADGKPDFLMRNASTGLAFAWFFDNASPIGDQYLFSVDPSWIVEAAGDLSGDGQPDLVFRNRGTGLAFVWRTRYSGGTLALDASDPALFSIDPIWEIVQLADWNGDGAPDFLFRNAGSGTVFVWYSDAGRLGGSDYVFQVYLRWEVVPRPSMDASSCRPSDVDGTPYSMNGQWRAFAIPRGGSKAFLLPVAQAAGHYGELTAIQNTATEAGLQVELRISACPGPMGVPAECKAWGSAWGGSTSAFAVSGNSPGYCSLTQGVQYYITVRDTRSDGTPSCVAAECSLILQYNGNLQSP
jgi:hypothetical protein